MRVTVRLLTGMRKYIPAGTGKSGACELAFEGATTVGTVLRELNIPDDKPKTVLVNRLHADRDKDLKDGDVLSIFEPISGG